VQVRTAPLADGFEELAVRPSRMSRRARRVLFAVLVLAAAVAGARALTRSDPPIRITVYGQSVADPGTVLSTAEANFESYADARRGRLGTDAECWFQRLTGSDVGSSVVCGPVLFYDGNPSAPYLSFPLLAEGADSPVRLGVASRPTTPEPSALPVDLTLVRPGGSSQPRRSAGFAPPIPPPAARDTLVRTDTVNPVQMVLAAPGAVIGGDLVNVRLDDYGPVTDFNSGAARRTAPAGMELFGFHLVFFGGENGFGRLSDLGLGVALGTGAPRPLPLPDLEVNEFGQLFVVAVRPGGPITLVLTEHGVSQRLSLRDGVPARSNVEYLAAPPLITLTPYRATVPATVTIGGHAERTHVQVNLDYGVPQFFLPRTGAHPAATDHMFLSLNLSYRSALLGRSVQHPFGTTAVTLTPRGGSPVRARVVAGSAGALFDVPADITEATITIAGTETDRGYTVSFPAPVRFPLRLTPRAG
jgi:hypothetical protein